MSADDKYTQMYGLPDPMDRGSNAYGDIERSQDVTALPGGRTLRGFNYRDGSRGVNLDARQPNNRPGRLTGYESYSTAFPAESIRASSWDVDLELQVGEAMGDEVMASLNNLLLAPSMDILRHPYFGRSQETYGEDSYHIGRMASALTAGIQQHVVACAKNFVANNIEQYRAQRNALMNEQTLREVYTRHFGMVVKDGGVGCVMAAYNAVNGTACTQNKHLLRDILKGDLGFRGFVISDWWAMPGGDAHVMDTSMARSAAVEAVSAGLDVELPWSLNFAQLSIAVNNGDILSSQIDDAVGRILEQKFRFGIAYPQNGNDPKSGPWGLGTAVTQLGGTFGESLTNTQKHLDLAAESEVRSAVLLSNGTGSAPVLPISDANKGLKVAVLGLDIRKKIATSTNFQPGDSGTQHFATDINTGDRGSSRVNSDPASSIGPYDGIRLAALNHGLTSVTSGNSVAGAQNADLVVVVVGLTAGDEGEEYSNLWFGDRSSLELPGGQNDFVNSVLNLNKPTVVIIESGSIVNVPWLSHANKQQATIWAGYSGQYGGLAYGKLLFGDRNFSGKLAVSWPQEGDLRNLISFGDSDPDNLTMPVTMPYFHGYRLYDKHPEVNLAFPFGFGLSYTTFAYSNLQVPCASVSKTGVVDITVDVENTGSVDGDEVVMLFVAGPPKPANITGDRPIKELKRFQRVNGLKAAGQPGSTVRVTLPLAIQELRHWEGGAGGAWVIDPGEYTIMVGPNSVQLPLTGKLTVHD
jgi:beta-glucosidase